MAKMKMSRPKWSEIGELAKNITKAESFLLERRNIFDRMVNSDTISEKDKATATEVINQIDDICTDNKLVIKNINSVVSTKTHLKPRAGIKEKEQGQYLDLITKIDTRLSATGAFDEMLIQRLNLVMKK